MSLVLTDTSRGLRLRQSAGSAITNTTAETSLISATLPAGIMGLARALEFVCVATITTPLVSIPTLTIRVKFGGSTLTVAAGLSLVASLTNAPILLSGSIANIDATNVQYVYCEVRQSGGLVSQPISIANGSFIQQAAFAEDTTAAVTFSITAQFGGLSATTNLTHQFSKVEVV